LPWGTNPESEHAADVAQQFMNIVSNVNELPQIANVMIANLSQGANKGLEALQVLLLEELSYPAPNYDAVMTLARKAAHRYRERSSGYFLYTRIKYKECVCKSKWIFYSDNREVEMPKDKSAGWKRWDYTARGVEGMMPFLTDLAAMAKAADACDKHLSQWKDENE
jgi:hypothetical protein